MTESAIYTNLHITLPCKAAAILTSCRSANYDKRGGNSVGGGCPSNHFYLLRAIMSEQEGEGDKQRERKKTVTEDGGEETPTIESEEEEELLGEEKGDEEMRGVEESLQSVKLSKGLLPRGRQTTILLLLLLANSQNNISKVLYFSACAAFAARAAFFMRTEPEKINSLFNLLLFHFRHPNSSFWASDEGDEEEEAAPGQKRKRGTGRTKEAKARRAAKKNARKRRRQREQASIERSLDAASAADSTLEQSDGGKLPCPAKGGNPGGKPPVPKINKANPTPRTQSNPSSTPPNTPHPPKSHSTPKPPPPSKKNRLDKAQTNKTNKTKTGRRPPQKGHSFDVAITYEGRAATEEDRRSQMEALALAISTTPSSSTEPPIALRDSRVVNGVITISTGSQTHQTAVTAMLSGQPGVRVVAAERRRRLRMGIPGYLARMTGEQLIGFFESQNPRLPRGSLHLVSLLPGPHPAAFIDADQSAQNYLRTTGWTLQTMTVAVELRVPGGGIP